MEEKNLKLFDAIDIGNLYSQWHRDIRNFITEIKEDCALYVLKNSKVVAFNTFDFRKILNFTNTENCKLILDRILNAKDKSSFIDILKERDSLYPRDGDRGFTIEEIFESVVDNSYHPILFLELNKNYYFIDGRTRFYCCLFLNKTAKVKIITDYDLINNCK